MIKRCSEINTRVLGGVAPVAAASRSDRRVVGELAGCRRVLRRWMEHFFPWYHVSNGGSVTNRFTKCDVSTTGAATT